MIYTMEYYSAMRKKEILLFSTTWMNPEDIMLSEKNKSQKGTYCIIPFIKHSRNDKIIEMENRLVVARS